MSRIGNRIITVPEGVTVEVKENTVFVKGPKGELNTPVAKNINVEVKENTVLVTRNNEQITTKQLHGTTNANIANMINGVKDGYTKNLEIVGVGYRFTLKGNTLVISISGIDKVLVGEFAANVRKVRKPEPYKGKGIKYAGEHIRRKEGKKAK